MSVNPVTDRVSSFNADATPTAKDNGGLPNITINDVPGTPNPFTPASKDAPWYMPGDLTTVGSGTQWVNNPKSPSVLSPPQFSQGK